MTNVSLHRFPGLFRRFFVALGWGLGLLTIGAIAPPPSPTQDTAPLPPRLPASYQQLPDLLNTPVTLWHAAKTLPGILTIQIYTPTDTCEGFQAEARAIAADQAIAQVVHRVLMDQTPHLLDFELAGYRLQPDPHGNRLTIDFRRAPAAQRHFVSLSICEQQVLFGSLRKTLLENPALNINAVDFTERGQPIQF